MDVRRLLDLAARGERGGAVARRNRVGPRVLAAREPKLLRASTRLSAARTRATPAQPVIVELPERRQAAPVQPGAAAVAGRACPGAPGATAGALRAGARAGADAREPRDRSGQLRVVVRRSREGAVPSRRHARSGRLAAVALPGGADRAPGGQADRARRLGVRSRGADQRGAGAGARTDGGARLLRPTPEPRRSRSLRGLPWIPHQWRPDALRPQPGWLPPHPPQLRSVRPHPRRPPSLGRTCPPASGRPRRRVRRRQWLAGRARPCFGGRRARGRRRRSRSDHRPCRRRRPRRSRGPRVHRSHRPRRTCRPAPRRRPYRTRPLRVSRRAQPSRRPGRCAGDSCPAARTARRRAKWREPSTPPGPSTPRRRQPSRPRRRPARCS